MRLALVRLKLVYVSLAVISLMTLTSTGYAEIDPETVSAMWLFEESSGKIAEDGSGNGNDADITNGEYVEGKFGKALSFDGDGAAEAETFSNADGRYENHTYMLWTKQDGLGSEIPFNAGAGRVMNIHLNEAANAILVGWSGMAGDWLRIAGVWTADEWHNIAVTFDGDDMIVYLDGEVVGERGSPGNPPAETGSFLMGRFLGGGYFYKGIVDDVVVFTVALEEEDVRDVMNRGIEEAMGGTAVSPIDNKLTSTWGKIKSY